MAEPSYTPEEMTAAFEEMDISHLKAVKTAPGIPINGYIEPKDTAELAVTSDRILENYPFFGTLLKQENGQYSRKEVISANNPKTIDDVENRYGGGRYQLRLKRMDGTEEQINFTVTVKEPPVSQTQQNKEFLDSIRNDVREETRLEYQDRLNSLQHRLKAKDEELDDLTGRVRRLTLEIADAERSAKSRYEDEIRRLEEDNRQLDRDNFEMKMIQKIEGRNKEGVIGFLEGALENEAVQSILDGIIQRFSNNATQLPTQMLAGSTQPSPEQPQHSTPQQTDMQQMLQQTTQNVVNEIFELGVNALNQTNVIEPGFIKDAINGALLTLQQQGMPFPAENWINIAKGLVQYTIQQGIETERLADVIAPLLDNVGTAKTILKTTPVKIAVGLLQNAFNLQINEQEKAVLTQVLEIFKTRLK